MANKFDGDYKITKVLGNDRYELASLQGVRGYKWFKAVAAVDSLRRYLGGAITAGAESCEDSDDSERRRSGNQDLIDLLES